MSVRGCQSCQPERCAQFDDLSQLIEQGLLSAACLPAVALTTWGFSVYAGLEQAPYFLVRRVAHAWVAPRCSLRPFDCQSSA